MDGTWGLGLEGAGMGVGGKLLLVACFYHGFAMSQKNN